MTSHTAHFSSPKADIILKNGPIWCGLEEGIVESLAIWQDSVLAAGDECDLAPLCGPDTKVIDLEGRLATPGFTDAHMHIVNLGVVMGWVDVSPEKAPTMEALLSAIKARVDTTPPGEWVCARGYDQTKLDVGRHPLLEELDIIAPNNPVLVVRTCTHIQICNSLALQKAGISETTEQPEDGLIEKKEGKLTGLLAENAAAPVQAVIPVPDEDEIVDAIERVGHFLLSIGITSCMDAAVGYTAGFSEIPAYFRAQRENRLPVRVYMTLQGGPEGQSIVERCHKSGLVTGNGDPMLRIGAVKLFLDGSVGGRTAWMSEPYLGDDNEHGIQMVETEALEARVLDLHKMGYQLACHAIGDGAIDQLITAYEKALAALPDPDRRHRVEHSAFIRDDQIKRMAAAKIYPSPQQIFIYDFADSYVKQIGMDRVMKAYPQKTFTELGMKPPAGSDAPVSTPAPFANIYTMLTRKSWKGTQLDTSECVSIEQALQSYTEFGAFSQKQEDVKGKLLPGYLADIAIFSRNLLESSPEEILKDTCCDMTILGGKIVYERG